MKNRNQRLGQPDALVQKRGIDGASCRAAPGRGFQLSPLLGVKSVGAVVVVAAIAGCSSTGVNLGVSIPIGPNVGIGVGVGSDGRVSTGVGVSVGAGRVSVGTSGRLPNRAAPDPAAAASAPTTAPVAGAGSRKD